MRRILIDREKESKSLLSSVYTTLLSQLEEWEIKANVTALPQPQKDKVEELKVFLISMAQGNSNEGPGHPPNSNYSASNCLLCHQRPATKSICQLCFEQVKNSKTKLNLVKDKLSSWITLIRDKSLC